MRETSEAHPAVLWARNQSARHVHAPHPVYTQQVHFLTDRIKKWCSWPLISSYHNHMCDSCQGSISSHQRSEENSTGAESQHRLWRDPEVTGTLAASSFLGLNRPSSQQHIRSGYRYITHMLNENLFIIITCVTGTVCRHGVSSSGIIFTCSQVWCDNLRFCPHSLLFLLPPCQQLWW